MHATEGRGCGVDEAHISFPTDRRRSYGRRSYDRFNLASMRGFVHDVVNSVSAVTALLETVLYSGSLSSSARRRLFLAHREQRRLIVFLEQFLDDTRAMSLCPVDVREVVESVAALVAATTSARLTVPDGPDIAVSTDAVVLWRTLHNLVGNAVRAAGPRGHVEVIIARDCDTLRIDVVDSGPGFGAAEPGRESLGLELVGALLAKVQGRATFVEGSGTGTRVRVEIRLAVPGPVDPRCEATESEQLL
jgi:signal transduction histidine kinase